MTATILWQAQSGNPGWYLGLMVAVSLVTVVLNWKSGERAAGRAEGAVTTALAAHKESQQKDNQALHTKIDGVEKGLKDDILKIEGEQIRQWDSIGANGRKIAAVEGQLAARKAAGV